jgi:NAD(P)-dependent dehydrogenase (short-subunit alcohol dehydrogenase family)
MSNMTGRGNPTGVVVITGTGGMGRAIAHRLAPGRHLVLADVAEGALAEVATALTAIGHVVTTQRVDVSDGESVAALARVAADLGPILAMVHTAGVSPVHASAEAVIAVDLVGTAHVLDAFAPVIARGGAGVVIASMAGHLGPAIETDLLQALATVPTDELSSLPALEAIRAGDSGLAYSFAKRGNHVRVKAQSVAWGERGARLNSISPGVIATPMGLAELAGGSGAFMQAMVDGSGTGRLGTADDIAAATEFLVGPSSAFVTGTDLLVDGGAVAALTTGQVAFGGRP